MTDELQATLPEETPVDVTPDVTPEKVEAVEPPQMEDTIRETYRKLTQTERVRDEGGRFAKAAQAAQETPQAEAPTEAAPTEEVAPQVAQRPHDAPPNTWRKELQAEFGKLPESVREEIHRRESDFHKGIAQYKEAASFGHAMFEDVSPHFDAMRAMGATPQEVVRDVLGAWRNLATGSPEQKRATLFTLAQNFGISLSEAPQALNSVSSPPELTPVLQRLQQLEATITESQRYREQAEQAQLLSEAEKFLSDPKHEHLETVFEDVLALVRAGVNPEDAYNKAIWAHPDTRTRLLAKQDEDRRKREAAEAAAARKAAASNVVRRGTPPALPKTGSMEDTIRAAYRQLQG